MKISLCNVFLKAECAMIKFKKYKNVFDGSITA